MIGGIIQISTRKDQALTSLVAQVGVDAVTTIEISGAIAARCRAGRREYCTSILRCRKRMIDPSLHGLLGSALCGTARRQTLLGEICARNDLSGLWLSLSCWPPASARKPTWSTLTGPAIA